MIASLDIVMGVVALSDVWVIRAVKEKEVDGEYSLDNSLRCLVIVVGLAKYFFAELDYMPALVLSATNVYSNDAVRFERRGDGENPESELESDMEDRSEESASLSDGFLGAEVSSLSIDLCTDEEGIVARTQEQTAAHTLPNISAGMQYASFLSCIDFGAQIGDWITVPIVASLDITRENHWDRLDQFVIICSFCRMTRVVFLWLICPPVRKKKSQISHNSE
mmetsp:Transcript_32197/g.67302  ORF Transcript_32197/g.67302 Transcript_32197/m.67302 type:complete len:222 (+) Transcript_32197:3-668(+)